MLNMFFFFRFSHVAVGNLNKFIQHDEENYFRARVDVPNNLFMLESRTKCVEDAYHQAAQTPVHIIRAIDSYRSDGRCGSKLFICQPVFGDTKKKVNFMDIETRRVRKDFYVCWFLWCFISNAGETLQVNTPSPDTPSKMGNRDANLFACHT